VKKLLFKALNWIGEETVREFINKDLTYPPNGKDLDLAFIDDSGRKYFRYPKGLMPVCRMGAIQTYTGYLAVGLTPDLINNAFDDVEGYLAHGQTMKAGAVLESLKEFQRNSVNISAFLNIMAASYVREDEDANTQEQRIHAEKLDFLESKIEDTAFFFKQKEWRTLLERFRISTKDAEKLYRNYQAQKKAHSDRLEAITGTKFTKKSKQKDSSSKSS
jgi:hypothetical protein